VASKTRTCTRTASNTLDKCRLCPRLAERSGCGGYANYYDLEGAVNKITQMIEDPINSQMRINTAVLLRESFLVEKSYSLIINKVE
jgi:hypothetical protein